MNSSRVSLDGRHRTWSRISLFLLVPESAGHTLDAPKWPVLEVGNDSVAM
jgi:hypothetical protein